MGSGSFCFSSSSSWHRYIWRTTRPYKATNVLLRAASIYGSDSSAEPYPPRSFLVAMALDIDPLINAPPTCYATSASFFQPRLSRIFREQHFPRIPARGRISALDFEGVFRIDGKLFRNCCAVTANTEKCENVLEIFIISNAAVLEKVLKLCLKRPEL